MSNDDIKRILAAIDDLKSENALAHRGLVSMVVDIQKTQKDHTCSLGMITSFITGLLPHTIDKIAKKVGLQETGLTDKIIEQSRKAAKV